MATGSPVILVAIASIHLPVFAIGLLIAVGLGSGHLFGRSGPGRGRGRALGVAIVSRHPGVAITLGGMAGAADPGALIGAVLLYFLVSAVAGLVRMRATEPRLAH